MRNPKARIRLIGRSFELSLPLGVGRPMPTAGGAVYEEWERPQDVSVTIYVGDALIKMDIPILLDSFTGTGADQTPRLEQLDGLAQGRAGNPPPSFIARGPFQNSGMRFQMEPYELTDEPTPIVDADGNLLRQALTLKLIEFQDPQDIAFQRRGRNGARLKGQGAIGANRALTATVLRDGENLMQVSARQFGNPKYATQIGELNKIRDIRMKLQRGRQLRLPAIPGA